MTRTKKLIEQLQTQIQLADSQPIQWPNNQPIQLADSQSMQLPNSQSIQWPNSQSVQWQARPIPNNVRPGRTQITKTRTTKTPATTRSMDIANDAADGVTAEEEDLQ